MPWLASLAVVLLQLSLFLPVGLFLWYGWPVRRAAILAPFSAKAVKRYFQAFYPNDPRGPKITRDGFAQEFDARYGRAYYVLPILTLVLISSYLEILCVNSLFNQSLDRAPFFEDPLKPIIVAAFAGAYIWVVADMISRARTLDMSTSHINWACFRLVSSLPLGFAFAQFGSGNTAGLGLAILVGAFPAQTLGKIARRLAAKQLGMDDAPGDKRTRLDNLQDVDTTVADRFAEEGVTTIPQLAYADPVDMTMRTGFPFVFVVDCVSQALLWVYMDDYYAAAKAHGLRGALEVCGFLQQRRDAERKGDKQTEQDKRLLEWKQKTVQTLAEAVKVPTSVIEEQMDFIWSDKWVGFLVELTDDDE